jgi:hypothetical protein
VGLILFPPPERGRAREGEVSVADAFEIFISSYFDDRAAPLPALPEDGGGEDIARPFLLAFQAHGLRGKSAIE